MLRISLCVLLYFSGSQLAATEVIDGFICNAERLGPITQQPQRGLMYEAARITEVFDRCTRDRASNGSEEYLYTWGYGPKLQSMLKTERFEFCTRDQARIQTSTALHHHRAWSSNPNTILDQLFHEITKDHFTIPSESFYPTIKQHSETELLAILEKQLDECDGNLRCRARIQGRIDGVKQYQGGGFANTATRGMGVYFASDPISFLSHKSSDEHIGLVCDLSSTNLRITDLGHEDSEHALEEWMIRIPTQINRIPKLTQEYSATTRTVYPYYNVPAYEIAGHKHILRFHGSNDIYLDKCGIEYRASCKILSVDTLKSCEDIVLVEQAIQQLTNTSITDDNVSNQDIPNLGYYLIQQGGYRNTEHLLEALNQRRQKRCI